ncbi:hypothetical protein, partial [Sporisorium scitamineum]
MRRIDLISKLVSPLFVSALTSTMSYTLATVVLLSVNAVTAIFELVFVGTVYRRFPSLAADEKAVIARRQAATETSSRRSNEQTVDGQKTKSRLGLFADKMARSITDDVKQQYRDWKLFVRLPIFLTSLCISLLYMSVLSFDPTFIAYLKSETLYSDAFIAGMRAVGVVTGLIGTFIMP